MSSNSPQSNQKPDLDETINVTQAHGRVASESAATAREHRIADNGHEPISLWVIVSCGIALLIGGAVLGNATSWFDYDTLVKPKYVRGTPEGAEPTGPVAKEALAAYVSKGQKIYSAVGCAGCHGADGRGSAVVPPLAGSAWVKGDTQKFSMVILNGLQGPTSSGKDYGVMAAIGAGLKADELAGLMTYVRNGFGNTTGDIVTIEMAQAAIEASAAREKPGSAVNAAELTEKHSKMLPGAPLDPKTMVDPAKLTPVP
ncbi:MAG: cytochrome c [Verrucomicrobiota bacterium]